MPSLPKLIERLPSLYRPEPGDGTLLTSFLGAVAAELDHARDEASMVLPAHWYRHADRAAFDPWFTRMRERAALSALVPTDLVDFLDARAFLLAVHDANTPLTEYVREQFGPLQTELDDWDGLTPPPVILQRRALNALTRLIRGPLIYDADRFEDVTLDAELIARAEANPPGAERNAVNTELLLAGFPDSLQRAILDLAWVRDLGRLAASVPLTPWREPTALRETVEAFRIRLGRTIALYRNGLGTVNALRSIVEATLPIDPLQPAELRDLPISIEEFTPLAVTQIAAPTNGPPAQMVGPLMRWGITNPGIADAAPTVLITGLAPAAGIAPTAQPIIELFELGSGARPRIGIGYVDTIAPDTTLRLRPAFRTWTIGVGGLLLAESLPGDESSADPSEPDAPQAVPGAPADITNIFATSNGMLWAAAANGTTLARFDGTSWTDVANGLAVIRCFAEHDAALLIGTADGLLRSLLFPGAGEDATPVAVAGFDDIGIRVIEPTTNAAEYWIGTDEGALHWDGSAAPDLVSLGGDAAISSAVHAVTLDPGGNVHFGCDLGVFEFQPARDEWYWYAGAAFTEQTPEWQRFTTSPGGAPAAERVFLPEVLAARRGPDASLWFGTSAGIARYVARAANGGTYTTLLEAFPDICEGPVTRIIEDARGGVWFATERGLMRFDGRDWWQRRSDRWVHLGRADQLPGVVARPRGGWRFDRATAEWQRFDTTWVVPVVELRTTAEPAVTLITVSDHVVADVGSFDGTTFTHSENVDAADLVLRMKPAEDRIVDGGMPYLPRVPTGTSIWRYLSREADDLIEPPMEPRPAWSSEGRLFPPPPSLDAPYAGRFDIAAPPEGHFDQGAFAFDPAARVTFQFEPRQPCSVLVRLHRRADNAPFDPAVLDRIWDGIQQVRPAGIRVLLAVDETIVRGS
jgi:hypothetical protein